MASLTWFGHSGFVIEADGQRVAIDVWKDAPTFPAKSDLDRLKVVLATHGHFDHVSSLPELCKASGAPLLCIHEVSFWAQQQGLSADQVIGMNKGGTYGMDGWRFSMVDAVHSSGCPGPADQIAPGGAAAGWMIETPDGQRVYHAGDTAAFMDMKLIRDLHAPTVALLPIGGHFTMGPKEAAMAVRLLGVHHVVPMHYGTFPLLTGTPDELRENLPAEVTVHALEPGASLELDRLVVTA